MPPVDDPPLQILDAAPAHAGVLAAMQAAALGSGDETWPETAWAGWLAAPGVAGLLACRDGQPLGLALGRAVADEGEVLTLAVESAARGRGLGRLLLDALLARLAGFGAASAVLEVAVDNSPALALYRAAGFKSVGRRSGYYVAGDRSVDALILRRRLILRTAE